MQIDDSVNSLRSQFEQITNPKDNKISVADIGYILNGHSQHLMNRLDDLAQNYTSILSKHIKENDTDKKLQKIKLNGKGAKLSSRDESFIRKNKDTLVHIKDVLLYSVDFLSTVESYFLSLRGVQLDVRLNMVLVTQIFHLFRTYCKVYLFHKQFSINKYAILMLKYQDNNVELGTAENFFDKSVDNDLRDVAKDLLDRILPSNVSTDDIHYSHPFSYVISQISPSIVQYCSSFPTVDWEAFSIFTRSDDYSDIGLFSNLHIVMANIELFVETVLFFYVGYWQFIIKDIKFRNLFNVIAYELEEISITNHFYEKGTEFISEYFDASLDQLDSKLPSANYSHLLRTKHIYMLIRDIYSVCETNPGYTVLLINDIIPLLSAGFYEVKNFIKLVDLGDDKEKIKLFKEWSSRLLEVIVDFVYLVKKEQKEIRDSFLHNIVRVDTAFLSDLVKNFIEINDTDDKRNLNTLFSEIIKSLSEITVDPEDKYTYDLTPLIITIYRMLHEFANYSAHNSTIYLHQSFEHLNCIFMRLNFAANLIRSFLRVVNFDEIIIKLGIIDMGMESSFIKITRFISGKNKRQKLKDIFDRFLELYFTGDNSYFRKSFLTKSISSRKGDDNIMLIKASACGFVSSIYYDTLEEDRAALTKKIKNVTDYFFYTILLDKDLHTPIEINHIINRSVMYLWPIFIVCRLSLANELYDSRRKTLIQGSVKLGSIAEYISNFMSSRSSQGLTTIKNYYDDFAEKHFSDLPYSLYQSAFFKSSHSLKIPYDPYKIFSLEAMKVLINSTGVLAGYVIMSHVHKSIVSCFNKLITCFIEYEDSFKKIINDVPGVGKSEILKNNKYFTDAAKAFISMSCQLQFRRVLRVALGEFFDKHIRGVRDIVKSYRDNDSINTNTNFYYFCEFLNITDNYGFIYCNPAIIRSTKKTIDPEYFFKFLPFLLFNYTDKSNNFITKYEGFTRNLHLIHNGFDFLCNIRHSSFDRYKNDYSSYFISGFRKAIELSQRDNYRSHVTEYAYDQLLVCLDICARKSEYINYSRACDGFSYDSFIESYKKSLK